MTVEEAIEVLKNDIEICTIQQKQACDMAIKVLEQQPAEDCVSRKAMIDAIYKKYVGGKDAVENAPINDLYACGLEEAVDAVENIPPSTPSYNSVKTELEQTRWIPCSEKMPDVNIHVLAQFVMGGMAECYFAHNWWHIVGGFRISGDEVIAWMPLPPCYEPQESEDNK